MRAILRFSIDGEKNSALRNKLVAAVEGAGFVRNKNTATFEHQSIGPAALSAVLGAFWIIAHGHKGNGKVDHFWMYSDRTDLDDIHPN